MARDDASTGGIVTHAQRDQYEADGYVLVRELIPRDVCERVRRRVDEVAAGDHDWPARHFQYVDPTRFERDDGGAWPAGIQQPAMRDAVFEEMAAHPRLIGAMRDLLGGAVTRHTDQCLIKYGFLKDYPQGGCSYYHQDSYYWRVAPRLGCNCWIALDPVGRDAIALGIKPGTHHDWALVEHESYDDAPLWYGTGSDKPMQRHRIPLDKVDDSDEVVIDMQPGDGLFFTNFTWHRSEPNRTGRDLAAYAIAYKLSETR